MRTALECGNGAPLSNHFSMRLLNILYQSIRQIEPSEPSMLNFPAEGATSRGAFSAWMPLTLLSSQQMLNSFKIPNRVRRLSLHQSDSHYI
ncbi:hypothetical protein [Burkholderia sp. Bp9140]|uniref:hypothetical protein n=1 Tax=Burkholderia sp. Bp9140 TaxID=2184572 RepID=UPI000F582338|nr:hypothetical protein [Burkholderia sp. Bp9140]